MEFLESVISVLFNATIVAFVMLAVKYIYVGYFFFYRKKELLQINSVISAYKLKLKTKIATQFGSVKSDKSELYSLLEPITNRVVALTFDNPEDYNTVIESVLEIMDLQGINRVLSGQKNLSTENPALEIAPQYQQTKKAYERVFEFDKDLMIFIIEIKKLTDEYLAMVEEYNHYREYEPKVKKITNLPKPIEINGFPILLDIYNDIKSELAVMRSLQAQDRDDKAYDAIKKSS